MRKKQSIGKGNFLEKCLRGRQDPVLMKNKKLRSRRFKSKSFFLSIFTPITKKRFLTDTENFRSVLITTAPIHNFTKLLHNLIPLQQFVKTLLPKLSSIWSLKSLFGKFAVFYFT